MFQNTPTAVSVYARQARQTRNGTLIAALDELYIRTLEAYAHARFFPDRPKISGIDGRVYHFRNDWKVDLDERLELESSPSHRNVQKHFARDAARLIFDHCGLSVRELMDYSPYFNRILQFYGVMDSAGVNLAYVNFWGQTVGLLSVDCNKLVDCVYASNANTPAQQKLLADKAEDDSERAKRNRKDKGNPRG